jgi:hypothetical protein
VLVTIFSGFQFVSVRSMGIVDLVTFVMVATVYQRVSNANKTIFFNKTCFIALLLLEAAQVMMQLHFKSCNIQMEKVTILDLRKRQTPLQKVSSETLQSVMSDISSTVQVFFLRNWYFNEPLSYKGKGKIFPVL